MMPIRAEIFNKYDDVIGLKAKALSVDPCVVKAICISESALDVTAKRNEPAFYRRYIKGRRRWTAHRYYHQPEIIAAGIGLMQVQYTTALWMGFRPEMPWHQLFDVSLNLDAGIRWYRNRLRKYGGNQSDAISAYNAGTARLDGNRYSNQPYVDKVYRYMIQVGQEWKQHRPEMLLRYGGEGGINNPVRS